MYQEIEAGGYTLGFEGEPGGTVTGLVSNFPENGAHSQAEVAFFKEEKPDRMLVYVDEMGGKVTTFMGDLLGQITGINRYRTNLANMCSIRFRGINGCTYYGRLSADWTQAMTARKAKG